jgi:hypothetical protein
MRLKFLKKTSLKILKYNIKYSIFLTEIGNLLLSFEIRRDFKKMRKHERLKEITRNKTKID